MANQQSSTTEASIASPGLRTEPMHIPLSPLRQDKLISNEAHLAARVLSVARGAQVIAQIMHSNVIASENGDRPLLDVNSIDALAGLLSESMGLLAGLAESRIEFFNASASQGA